MTRWVIVMLMTQKTSQPQFYLGGKTIKVLIKVKNIDTFTFVAASVQFVFGWSLGLLLTLSGSLFWRDAANLVAHSISSSHSINELTFQAPLIELALKRYQLTSRSALVQVMCPWNGLRVWGRLGMQVPMKSLLANSSCRSGVRGLNRLAKKLSYLNFLML